MSRRERLYFAGFLAFMAVLFAIATCVSCAAMPTQPRRVGRDIVDQHRAAVTVRLTCAPGRQMYGSGVVVNDRLVTAAHVVMCEIMPGVLVTGNVEVNPGDGRWREGHVLIVDTDNDLAVVEAPDLRAYASPIEVGPPPALGDTVCMASGLFPHYVYKCGMVGPGNGSGDIVFDVVVIPGNSGSGLYDAYGRLVGIVVRFRTCRTLPWVQACDGIASPLWPRRQSLGIW